MTNMPNLIQIGEVPQANFYITPYLISQEMLLLLCIPKENIILYKFSEIYNHTMRI